MAKQNSRQVQATTVSPPKKRTAKTPAAKKDSVAKADSYVHKDTQSPLRPDVGTQPRFRNKKPPKTYRYDSSLSPSLERDEKLPKSTLYKLCQEGEVLVRKVGRHWRLHPGVSDVRLSEKAGRR